MLRKVGYILVAAGLVQAIVILVAGLQESPIIFSFGACMSLGSLLLMISGVRALANGTVRLRPLAALKLMPVYLLIFAAVFLVIDQWFSGSSDKTFTERLFLAGGMSIFISFYTTAYRRRV